VLQEVVLQAVVPQCPLLAVALQALVSGCLLLAVELGSGLVLRLVPCFLSHTPVARLLLD
jgi:hypothetical protein